MKKMIKKNQKGSVLYFAVLLLGILFTSGAVLTVILIQRIRMINEMSYSIGAFYAADSGIEKILYRWGDMPEEEGDEVLNWDNPEDLIFTGPGENQHYELRREIREENGIDMLIITSVGEFKPGEEWEEGVRRGIQISRPIENN